MIGNQTCYCNAHPIVTQSTIHDNSNNGSLMNMRYTVIGSEQSNVLGNKNKLVNTWLEWMMH